MYYLIKVNLDIYIKSNIHTNPPHLEYVYVFHHDIVPFRFIKYCI